jgi:serine/threonine protein kinase
VSRICVVYKDVKLNLYFIRKAYMAPEVFTKNNSDGHGRAADIWSIGCCVIEMASGKVIYQEITLF